MIQGDITNTFLGKTVANFVVILNYKHNAAYSYSFYKFTALA